MKLHPSIENLKPYKPGKPIEETRREYGLDEVVKLASNESPIGVSKKVLDAISEGAKELHRYPDPGCHKLKLAMAEYLNVEKEHLVFSNGSNELIDLLIKIYCEPGDKVLTSSGAFIAYKVCSHANRAELIETPMTEDMKFDVDAIIESAKNENPKIVFIANPNNPTGTYLNTHEVNKILNELGNRSETLLVFDEAYNEFVRAKDYPQLLSQYTQYDNVVIMKTFSKVFGLAGIRIGAIVAKPSVIDVVNKVRNPFNVNHLAQVATIAAINDNEYLDKAKKVNWDGLDFFYDELEKMGLKYWPSEANFVLFDTEKDSDVIYEELLKLGVILRPIKGYGFNTHLRMSVGTMAENTIAVKALKKVLTK